MLHVHVNRVFERLADGFLAEVAHDLVVSAVVDGLDLDLAQGGGGQCVQIGHSGHGRGLPGAERPSDGCGGQRLVVGHGQPHRHPRALIDVGAQAGDLAEIHQHLAHEVGHDHRQVGLGHRGLLLGDVQLDVHVGRVVGADLGPKRSFSGVMMRPRLV